MVATAAAAESLMTAAQARMLKRGGVHYGTYPAVWSPDRYDNAAGQPKGMLQLFERGYVNPADKNSSNWCREWGKLRPTNQMTKKQEVTGRS